VDSTLLDPMRKEPLAPGRVERIAKEMRAYFFDRTRTMETRAIEAPRELQELCARIDRLHERVKQGDADMTAENSMSRSRSTSCQEDDPRLSHRHWHRLLID
jgi:hypothetical protein